MLIIIFTVLIIICIIVIKNKSNDTRPPQNKGAAESTQKEASPALKQRIPSASIKSEMNAQPKNEKAELLMRSQVSNSIAGERILTPHQHENEKIKEGILDNMCAGTQYSIADMLCTFDCFPENMTPNRLSALLSQLGPKGSQQIERIEKEGVVYFALPDVSQVPAPMNPTPHQQDNEKIKAGILNNMHPGTVYSIADMLCTFDCFPDTMTPNNLSSLLSQLGPKGTQQIERIEQKGKVYFTLALESGLAVTAFETIENMPQQFKTAAEERTLTPHQLENESIKEGILDNMHPGKVYSIADMLCTFDCFPETMTPNRLAALLSQLGEHGSGEIMRIEDNDKAFYKLTENGIQRKTTVTSDYKKALMEAKSRKSAYSTDMYGSSSSYGTIYNSFGSGTQKTRKRTEYFTDWDGRKYYFDKNGVKQYKQERVYYTDWDGRQYYFNKNGEKKYRQERKQQMNNDYYDDPFEDPRHYNNYRNGPTDHGTFIGNCKMCGTTWEFPSSRVIPVPYPHATCPNCHQWVAVF